MWPKRRIVAAIAGFEAAAICALSGRFAGSLQGLARAGI